MIAFSASRRCSAPLGECAPLCRQPFGTVKTEIKTRSDVTGIVADADRVKTTVKSLPRFGEPRPGSGSLPALFAQTWFPDRNSQAFSTAVFLPQESISLHSFRMAKDFEIMKGIVAACIALGVLWGIDAKMNDGRYSAVLQQVVVGVLPK
jgi:hypothetical protein